METTTTTEVIPEETKPEYARLVNGADGFCYLVNWQGEATRLERGREASLAAASGEGWTVPLQPDDPDYPVVILQRFVPLPASAV